MLVLYLSRAMVDKKHISAENIKETETTVGINTMEEIANAMFDKICPYTANLL